MQVGSFQSRGSSPQFSAFTPRSSLHIGNRVSGFSLPSSSKGISLSTSGKHAMLVDHLVSGQGARSVERISSELC